MRELLARIGADELVEWEAMYRIDPWGTHRGDLQAGIVAATLANVNRKEGSRAFDPGEFCLEFTARQEQTAEEMAMKLRTFTANAGGEVR